MVTWVGSYLYGEADWTNGMWAIVVWLWAVLSMVHVVVAGEVLSMVQVCWQSRSYVYGSSVVAAKSCLWLGRGHGQTAGKYNLRHEGPLLWSGH